MKRDSELKTLNNELPITYYCAVSEGFEIYADECGVSPAALRRMTVLGILNRHVDAERKPEYRNVALFCLALGGPKQAVVYYSVDAQMITVRGYGWEIGREPLDDRDGGCCYLEPAWD